MDQHWHQEATLREIAEAANKVKEEAARQETEKQIETVLAFLRKNAAQGLFEAEYSGFLNEEARRRLANSRNKLKIEPAGRNEGPAGAWSIKW
jgi:hypothetical protein